MYFKVVFCQLIRAIRLEVITSMKTSGRVEIEARAMKRTRGNEIR